MNGKKAEKEIAFEYAVSGERRAKDKKRQTKNIFGKQSRARRNKETPNPTMKEPPLLDGTHLMCMVLNFMSFNFQ